MKNLLTKLRYVPKQFAIATAIMVAGASAVLTYAWGPSRTTFTMESPAPYVTFNSITNNPEYGDEREFLTVRDLTTGQTLGGSTTIVPGHEYLFQVYIHNNAASNLNTAENGYKGIARGTTVEAAVPSTVNGSADAAAYVRATNAAPAEVWDTVKLTSTGSVTLDYQEGSARLFTKAYATGTPLSDAIMTDSGIKVGYDNLNGDWPGCLPYSGTVTFKMKAVAPVTNFTLVKDVRKDGTTTYGQTASVAPGDKVNYRISFKNTGETTLNNVVIKDTLPQGMTYVAGTAKLSNAAYQYPNMYSLSDKFFTTGENIGNYLPNGNANVTFTAQVAANDALPTCGMNTLKNIAKAETDTAYLTDDADVTVTKTCVTPAATCKALTATQISRTEFSFVGTATAENGATVSKYTFVVKNSAGAVVKTVTVNSTALSANSGTITLDAVGVYTVALTVTTSLGDKTATSCQTTVEVKPAPIVPVYTCNNLTVNQISRTQFTFATDYTVTNATFVRVDYVVRNAAGVEVYRGPNSSYTQTTVGTYTVEAVVVVKVNGVEKTATSATCKKPFEVKPADNPAVDIDKKVIDADGKPVDMRSVAVGTPYVYQVVVKNTGNVALKGVAVRDAAPANVTFVSADSGTIVNNVWSTTVDLAVNESKTFKITAKVTAVVEGSIVNTACVNAPEVNPGEPNKADDCDDATVNVPTPEVPTIKVCNLKTRVVVTIKETDFDSSKHSKNLDDCKDINVCRLSDKTVITIKESEFDTSKYSRNVEDCKTAPVTIRVCELNTKQIVTITSSDFNASRHSRTTTDCNAPTVIANTGPEMLVGSLLGSSALGLGVSSYVRSRSALHRATRRS